jgi:hypothetical protein
MRALARGGTVAAANEVLAAERPGLINLWWHRMAM